VNFTLIVVFFIGEPYLVWAGEKPIGKVIAIIGTVEYQRGPAEPVARSGEGEVLPVSLPSWQPVKARQEVFASDTFRTSRKSRLRILFEDRSLLALGPGAEMKVKSYLYKPEDKLRQGVIGVAHGLSMYIINKEQDNPDSSFKVVSPTANITARGTHGYLSISEFKTLVANKAGSVWFQNADPAIQEQVIVGAMMRSIIESGKPPTQPQPFTPAELNIIRQMVLGWITSKFGEKPGEGSSVEEAFTEEFEPFDDAGADSCTSG